MIFRFVQVWVLILWIVPFIPYLWRRWKHPQSSTLLYSDIRLLPRDKDSYRVRLIKRLPLMRMIAWFLLVMALAQPQTGQSIEVIKGSGIDIAIVLDGSSSMNAEIVPETTRIDAAKRVIGDFVMGRDHDRLGLVMFAQHSYHQIPLTLDYPAFLTILETISTIPSDSPSDDGTAIGLGIASAVNMLRQSDAPSKVIILLTDGDNNAGLNPITAGEIAQLFGVRVYVVGLSEQGLSAELLIEDEGLTLRNNINVALMRRVANLTGGGYFEAEDIAGLQAIYQRIDQLERGEVERVIFNQWRDQAYGFIGVALFFLMVEFLLREFLFRTLP